MPKLIGGRGDGAFHPRQRKILRQTLIWRLDELAFQSASFQNDLPPAQKVLVICPDEASEGSAKRRTSMTGSQEACMFRPDHFWAPAALASTTLPSSVCPHPSHNARLPQTHRPCTYMHHVHTQLAWMRMPPQVPCAGTDTTLVRRCAYDSHPYRCCTARCTRRGR